MTRVAATEWGPDGINCNCICPLVMTDALKKWKEEYPAVYEQTIKGIPAGRFGDRRRISAEPPCSCARRTQSISPARRLPCRAAPACRP